MKLYKLVLLALVAALALIAAPTVGSADTPHAPPPSRADAPAWLGVQARPLAGGTCSSTCGVDFQWSGVNIAGATGYYVFLNGVQQADTTQTHYVINGLLCGTPYTLAVEAHDASGNTSQLYSEPYTTQACIATQAVLSIAKSGTGTGTITSSPSGINCGATCSASFNTSTQVTLTAAPASGSTFTGWSGGGCSGTSTCITTIGNTTTITATFTPSVTTVGTGPSLAQCVGSCVTPTFNTTGSAITTTDSDPDVGNTPLNVTRYVYSAVPGGLVTDDPTHPVPLVITFNDGCPGTQSTKAASCFDNTSATGDKGPFGWTQLSAANKFIVLDLFANTSNGFDLTTAFSAPVADRNCGSSGIAQCDQIPELVSAIQWAKSQWAIDPNKIFLTSGFFQNSFPIDAVCDPRVEPLLAGVGTVSGVLGGQTTATNSLPSTNGTCPALVNYNAALANPAAHSSGGHTGRGRQPKRKQRSRRNAHGVTNPRAASTKVVGVSNATACPAPTATGTGTVTTANPGDNLTTKANALTPGSVLVLNDGTYSPTVNSGTFGAWYINGIHGTATNPIIIEAANDGGATITGDNETTADVFYLTNSSYVTICGLNFKDAPANHAVFELWGAGGNNVGDGTVNNITVERTTATNAPSGDVDCFKFGSNDLTINAQVLFQDDAAMGPCRYGFANHHVNGVTDRRDWAYNMGVVNFANAPRSGFNAYGSNNVTIENSIAQNIPSQVDNNPYTGIYQTSNDPNLFPETNAHYYGDILYNVCEGLHATGNAGSGTILKDTYISVPANSTCSTNQGANYNPNGITWANPTTMTATNDVINASDDGVQMQPGSGAITFLNSALVNNNRALNNTSGTVNHTFSDFFGNTTNFATTPGNGGTLAASDLTSNPGYQASGLSTYLSPAPTLLGQGSGGADIGAHITNEYVDGTLTSTPLWPWPMESRIQAFAGISVTNSVGEASATGLPSPVANAHPLMYEDAFSARDATNGACPTPNGMPGDGVPVIANDCLDGGGITNKTPSTYEYSQDEISTQIVNPAFGCSNAPVSSTYPGDTFIKIRTYGNCQANPANGVATQVVDYTEQGCHNYACNGNQGGNTGAYGGAGAPAYLASLIWGFWTGSTVQTTGNAPANISPPTITGTAQEGSLLTCDKGTWSGDAPISYAYQWRRGGVDINVNGTSSTYTPILADVGSALTCVVTAANTAGSITATTAPTAAIAGIPPSGGTATITGTPSDGSTLTANPGTWTGDQPITFSYQWKRGATVVGTNSPTYPLTSADVGATITVTVTAINNSGSAQTTSAPTATIAAVAPSVNTAPFITGTPTQGQTLTANKGTWSGTTPITYTYQWLRDGTTAIGTGTTYVPVTADVGHNISVKVTATNTAGSTPATSASVGPIAASGPVTCPAPSHNLTLVKVTTATGDHANKGMFGPWTNHIVTTSNGDIYVAYLNVGNGSDVLGSLQLSRSTDGGQTFNPVYTSGGTNWHHIDLETDGTNVYMVTNFRDTAQATNFDGKLLKFVPGNLANPTITQFTNAASSKFSAIYNPVQGQIDVAYWSAFPGNQPNFLVVNPGTGAVIRSLQLFNSGQDGQGIVMQYPNLALDPAGDIFFAWHTVDNIVQNTTQNYYDAEFLYSTDNGVTWKGPGGTVTLPENPTPSGNNYEIVNTGDANEFFPTTSPNYTHNWNVLNSVAYNNGSLNFMYGGDAPQNHVSYAHLAWPGNTFSHRTDSWTSDNGTALKDGENSDGAFSQDSSQTGNLYFVGTAVIGGSTGPAVLDSPNSGTNWCTYATSGQTFSSMTYEGAARFVDTVNGQVQGIFSHTTNSPNTGDADIWFVRAPVP